MTDCMGTEQRFISLEHLEESSLSTPWNFHQCEVMTQDAWYGQEI